MTMKWRELSEMLNGLQPPPGYVVEQLARGDIRRVTELLRTWYPDIHVGSESRHLSPEFYENEFFLAGESRDRTFFAILVRSSDTGDIVGVQTIERNVRGLQVSSPMGVVEPSRRGYGLGHFGPLMFETVARGIGAEIAYYYSTLKSQAPQRAAERQGFKLVGLVPAFDVDAIAPGVHKRVYEALYAKVLVDPERVHVPPRETLTATTQALFDHLFAPEASKT